MEEKKRELADMSQVEKEALCYRLLVARDKINEKLRDVQESIQDNIELDKDMKSEFDLS